MGVSRIAEQPKESLVIELATESRKANQGLVDYEILGVIRDSTEVPDTYKAKVIIGTINRIQEAKRSGRILSFLEALDETDKRRGISINGTGRRDIIEGELAQRGVSSKVKQKVPKPTLYDKFFRKNVVEAYEEQQMEDLDLE